MKRDRFVRFGYLPSSFFCGTQQTKKNKQREETKRKQHSKTKPQQTNNVLQTQSLPLTLDLADNSSTTITTAKNPKKKKKKKLPTKRNETLTKNNCENLFFNGITRIDT